MGHGHSWPRFRSRGGEDRHPPSTKFRPGVHVRDWPHAAVAAGNHSGSESRRGTHRPRSRQRFTIRPYFKVAPASVPPSDSTLPAYDDNPRANSVVSQLGFRSITVHSSDKRRGLGVGPGTNRHMGLRGDVKVDFIRYVGFASAVGSRAQVEHGVGSSRTSRTTPPQPTWPCCAAWPARRPSQVVAQELKRCGRGTAQSD